MVKLQKHKSYTYTTDSGDEIDHYKYLVAIPESTLAELSWQPGQELELTVTKGKALTLKPSNAKRQEK